LGTGCWKIRNKKKGGDMEKGKRGSVNGQAIEREKQSKQRLCFRAYVVKGDSGICTNKGKLGMGYAEQIKEPRMVIYLVAFLLFGGSKWEREYNERKQNSKRKSKARKASQGFVHFVQRPTPTNPWLFS
jgi:hypothetical protein